MERERIERLALDEAAGELNEDTAALLHVYLAEHAQANRWAQEMAQACYQVRTAVEKKTASMPAESCRTPRAGRTIARRNGLAPARWAAVVALALLLGFQMGRRVQPSATRPFAPVRVISSNERGLGGFVDGQSSGFWQAKALVLREAKPRTGADQNVREDLWQKYRQYVKEHQHG